MTRHRNGDRYLPVRIFGYPVHGRGGPHREFGYVYNAKLYDTAEGAQRAGYLDWGHTPFSIAQIRDGTLVSIIEPDVVVERSPTEVAEHQAHLQWVWKEE